MTKTEQLLKREYLLIWLTQNGDHTNLEDIKESFCKDTFDTEYGEYTVLTDQESSRMAREYLLETVWAFNADFLKHHFKEEIFEQAEIIINALQESCEDGNEALLSLIEDKDRFVEEAISADGRAHFLSTYDGEEHEISIDGTQFYIYRTN